MSDRRIDNHWSELGSAIDTLSEGQSRAARAKARRTVMSKLRKLRSILDEDFPLERKVPKKRRKKKPDSVRHREFVARMKSIGYISAQEAGVDSTSRLAMIAAGGVRIHQDPTTVKAYVPIWVARLWALPTWKGARHITAASVRRVRLDKEQCRQLEAEWRLGIDNE